MPRVFKGTEVNMGKPYKIEETGIKSVFPNNKSTFNIDSNFSSSSKNNSSLSIDEQLERAKREIFLAEKKANIVVQEAQIERGSILNGANREAEKIVAAGELAARDIKKAAYTEGYEAGKQECEEIIEEANYIKAETEKKFQQVLKNSEAEIISLVIDIAKKVISEELEINRSRILDILKSALSGSSNLEKVTVKVSPLDYDYLNENRHLVFEKIEDLGDFELRKVESFMKGSCVVETKNGNIDASVEMKFKKIEEIFYEILQLRG